MISNAEYFASLTVPALKARLSDFNAKGISKLRKAELVNMLAVLIDGAHTDALAYAATLVTVPTVKCMTTPKRLSAYMSAAHGGNKLTAKQVSRMNKKIKVYFKRRELAAL